MKIAYCRNCGTVIAAGADLAPQQTYVILGKRRVVQTMPYHIVKGKEHRNVSLLDVKEELPIDAGNLGEFFKKMAEKYGSKFE